MRSFSLHMAVYECFNVAFYTFSPAFPLPPSKKPNCLYTWIINSAALAQTLVLYHTPFFSGEGALFLCICFFSSNLFVFSNRYERISRVSSDARKFMGMFCCLYSKVWSVSLRNFSGSRLRAPSYVREK